MFDPAMLVFRKSFACQQGCLPFTTYSLSIGGLAASGVRLVHLAQLVGLVVLLPGCARSAGGLLWHVCSETTMSVPQMSGGDFTAAVHLSKSPQPACTWNTALAESIKTQICCILVDGWSQAIIFVLH